MKNSYSRHGAPLPATVPREPDYFLRKKRENCWWFRYERTGLASEYREEYVSWLAMVSRCHDESNASYEHYGSRGIVVCDRWRVFANFIADMGARPLGKSIDRIDNNGPYSPQNCRWATPSEQARNKRNTVLVAYNNETLPAADWDERRGLPIGTVRSRLRRGWDVYDAIHAPLFFRRRVGRPLGELDEY